MRAANACFLGGHREKFFDQFGIERCAKTDGLWKTCRANRRMTMQTFFVENNRNSESRIFDEKFLDCIRQLRSLSGVFPNASVARRAARVTRPADLSDAVALFERGL